MVPALRMYDTVMNLGAGGTSSVPQMGIWFSHRRVLVYDYYGGHLV